EQSAGGEHCRHDQRNGDDSEVEARVEPERRGRGPGQRTDQEPDAPERVDGRHDRTAVATFHDDRMRVHCDIEEPPDPAEDEESAPPPPPRTKRAIVSAARLLANAGPISTAQSSKVAMRMAGRLP